MPGQEFHTMVACRGLVPDELSQYQLFVDDGRAIIELLDTELE